MAFEIDVTSGVSIGVARLDEDPDPFPTRAIVATTESTILDTRIIADSGHLWVTWVDSTNDVGWSEYDYPPETWAAPSYESYAQDDVQAARGRIRGAVLEP